jgi:putative methyltransferase
MSLYFDAVAILTAPSSGGSFKSRIYSARNLRATPAQIYALTTEAAKWDSVLAEVIDKAGILALERKVRLIARRPLRYLLTDQVISL